MKKHIRNECGFPCDKCGDGTNFGNSLSKHKMGKHEGNSNERIYRCNYCTNLYRKANLYYKYPTPRRGKSNLFLKRFLIKDDVSTTTSDFDEAAEVLSRLLTTQVGGAVLRQQT